jgi:hypothetical protein
VTVQTLAFPIKVARLFACVLVFFVCMFVCESARAFVLPGCRHPGQGYNQEDCCDSDVTHNRTVTMSRKVKGHAGVNVSCRDNVCGGEWENQWGK